MSLFIAMNYTLAIIFAVSGVPKVFKFKHFLQGIQDYNVVSNIYIIRGLGVIFVLSELFISFSLFTSILVPYSMIIGMCLLAAYGMAVLINLFKKSEIDCHCFDALGSSKLTIATFLRILILTSLLVTLYVMEFFNAPLIEQINFAEVLSYALLLLILFFANELLQKGLVLHREVKKQFG